MGDDDLDLGVQPKESHNPCQFTAYASFPLAASSRFAVAPTIAEQPRWQ